jgi:hypothetical protein
MENEAKPPNKIRRFLFGWAVITVLFAIGFVIEAYPDYPTSLTRGLLVFLIGPPLWLALNLAAEKFIGEPTARALDKLGEARLKRINTILLYVILVPTLLTLLLVAGHSFFE